MAAYLTVEQVADLLHCSPRSIHELTRTLAIPHRKLPGQRRILFLADEIERWVADQPELEVVELERGGRIVRPAEGLLGVVGPMRAA